MRGRCAADDSVGDVCVRALIATLGLLCWASHAAAGGDESSPCPGADSWRETHREQLPARLALRDQARTFSAPELRAELERRVETDQRDRHQYLAHPDDREARSRVQRMDADNLSWLKTVVKDGLPTVTQVGESGIHWAWLLVQHADEDPRFQLSLQPLFLERQRAGELPADDLARLTDRVLLAAGKPQRFGTQFDWLSGRFKPKGVVDLVEIDANRRALGLMPLDDYACMMNGKLKRE
jgi:hypothetical protein